MTEPNAVTMDQRVRDAFARLNLNVENLDNDVDVIQTALPDLVTDAELNAAVAAYSVAQGYVTATQMNTALAEKQDASTAATDAELAGKQDASTAATDAELATGLGTKQNAITAATGYAAALNVVADRTVGDADATTTDEVADVLITLINDLKGQGILGG